MSQKQLSIIVPSYNMEKYLPKCLGSLVVAPELMEELEVLVVNDGSKDRTSEIAHEFAAKWPGTFKVIDKENGHYGSCINAALKVASGKYVKVLDADDWFNTENFADFLRWLELFDVKGEGVPDLILTDYDCYDEEGRDTGKIRQDVVANEFISLADIVARKRITFMHGYTYRTELLRRIGYCQTEGIQYTDSEWVFEPAAFAEKVIYYPRVIYNYLFGRGGQSLDPSVVRNCMRQLEAVAVSVMERYERCKNKLTDEGRAYMMQLLERQIRIVYEDYLYFQPIGGRLKDLLRFDDVVRTSCWDGYCLTSDWRIPSKYGIPWLRVMRWLRRWKICIVLYANGYRAVRCALRRWVYISAWGLFLGSF